MLINSQKLIGLRVEAESGQYLGRIQSFDLDIDTQGVRNYYIRRGVLPLPFPLSNELKVHHRQVVDISDKKMVVLDNVVKYREKAAKRVFVGTEAGVS